MKHTKNSFLNYFLLILLSVFEFIYPLYPQNANTDLIQFSGVVVSSDSLQPIAFTNVIIENSNRGTISDYYGFFSIVAQKKDTIIFSAVGYKKNKFIIPDTLTVNRYSLIQVMSYDTIMLSETVIYPWPTLEQFKQAFMKVEIPDDDLERAKKNLALSEMKERYMNMPMDGSMNFKNLMDNKTSRLYYAGQYPPNNLLNPIAWAKFIQAWREGKFKRKN